MKLTIDSMLRLSDVPKELLKRICAELTLKNPEHIKKKALKLSKWTWGPEYIKLWSEKKIGSLAEYVIPRGYYARLCELTSGEVVDVNDYRLLLEHVNYPKKPELITQNINYTGGSSMNKVILIGRLTKEPEARFTAQNTPVTSFTLAVNRRIKQEGQPEADFIPVVTWNKTAEFCGKYFTKGQQVYVCGRMQNRSWDDTEGNKHYITEIVADEVGFADSKKDNQSDHQQNYQQPAAPAEQKNNPPPAAQGEYQAPASPPPAGKGKPATTAVNNKKAPWEN